MYADPPPVEIITLANPRATGSAEPSSLQYSLNLSFKVLSVLMTIWYILHSLLIIFQEPLTPRVPMRLSVLTTNVAALAAATEVGFEWLLKTSRLRRKRKKRREQFKKAASVVGESIREGSRSIGDARGAKVVGTVVIEAAISEHE
ncbi:hypothetical protein BCR44DRAFT_1444877 [Catenaria anguillulae PL171]|uniref:Uncharacterized protein n=1 Tax=Catenaria anguillulae PL171 TaxID=765915 RepID=A0A1Y2H8Z5_9FUNG|nr:hypothetical protein BCR44DRAFT_1444877 [Catenaria anguillulae PL171]